MSKKENQTSTFLKSFLLATLVLVGTVVSGFMTFKNIKNRSTYESTEAVITDITSEYSGGGYDSEDLTHTTIVTYTVDGKEYTRSLDVYKASHKIGKSVKILYDPESPANIQADSISTVIILCAVSVGLLVLTIIMYKNAFSELKNPKAAKVNANITTKETSEQKENNDEFYDDPNRYK